MDIKALTGSASGWYSTCGSPDTLSTDIVEAIETSLSGQISSLTVPHDFQLSGIDPVEMLMSALKQAIGEPGPYFIEVKL